MKILPELDDVLERTKRMEVALVHIETLLEALVEIQLNDAPSLYQEMIRKKYDLPE